MSKETNDRSAIDTLVESITNKLKLYAEGQKALADKIDANAAQARQINQEFETELKNKITTTFEQSGDRLIKKFDDVENEITYQLERRVFKIASRIPGHF